MALADMVAGMSGSFATLAALREVEVNGGKGQVVDLSLLEPMLAIMGPDVTAYAATQRVPEPDVKIASPRGVYRCRDGQWVAMSGSTDSMARRVFESIGQGALFADPRFSTNAARLANDAEVEAMVAKAIAAMDRDECLTLFRSQGVTVGPVHDPAQLLADEHMMRRECFVRAGDAQGTLMQNVAPRLSETPGAIGRPAPRLGEHTAQVLEQLGLPAVQIESLQETGAVRCS